MVSGAWLYRQKKPFRRGVGIHFFTWGLIDAIIAVVGLINNGRSAQSERADDPHFVAGESRKLERLLWINAGLDVFYVLGGVWLFRKKGENDPNWRGQGVGVVIQGLFLFLFDVWHALILRKK